MRNVLFSLMASLLVWTSYCYGVQSEPKPFVPGSYSAILAARQGRPFLLVLWSINCPPCRKELDLLADTHREYPMLDLVLIATDDTGDINQVRGVLAEYGLDNLESWIFADPNDQRLRYEIDDKWYGELPRSYFYDPEHNRIALSGSLKSQHLEAWIAAVQP